MSTKTALTICHVSFEDLGSLASPLQRAGLEVTFHDAGGPDLSKLDPLEVGVLVVLGGPVGVNEDIAYPFLAKEMERLRIRMVANLPTVGICLGAQLMPCTLGRRVYAASEKEIGWSNLAFTTDGAASALRHLEDIHGLHWHGDTFDLPQGVRLLASTQDCTTQDFSLGPRILAMLFHPEVEASSFENRLIGHAVELPHAGIDPRSSRGDPLEHTIARQERAEKMFDAELASALA